MDREDSPLLGFAPSCVFVKIHSTAQSEHSRKYSRSVSVKVEQVRLLRDYFLPLMESLHSALGKQSHVSKAALGSFSARVTSAETIFSCGLTLPRLLVALNNMRDSTTISPSSVLPTSTFAKLRACLFHSHARKCAVVLATYLNYLNKSSIMDPIIINVIPDNARECWY